MHQFHHSFDVLHRRLLQDAMTEVKNVTWSGVRPKKIIVDARLDLR